MNTLNLNKIKNDSLSQTMKESDTSGRPGSSKRTRSPSIERPSSNREIKQSASTIFPIEPAEWNNVPKIVYEAIATVVAELDTNRKFR